MFLVYIIQKSVSTYWFGTVVISNSGVGASEAMFIVQLVGFMLVGQTVPISNI